MRFPFRLAALSAMATPALIAMSCTYSASLTRKDSFSAQQSLLLMYQKAKAAEIKDAANSCQLYSRLSHENFILKDLSLLKAHLICQDTSGLDKVPDDLSGKEPWLANLDLDRQIAEAQRTQNFRDLTWAQFKKSQQSDQIRDKVQWLQLALESSHHISKPSADDKSLQNDIQNRIYRFAPRFKPNPLAKDFFPVAMDFIFQRQFVKGRSFLLKVINGKNFSLEEKFQARRAFRNSFKIEQNKDKYLKAASRFAQWARVHSSPARTHEAYLTLAKAQWTEGHAQLAKKTLKVAEKYLKAQKYPLDEVNFVRARMSLENQNFDNSLEHLAQAEKDSRKGSLLRDKILFNEAWVLRKKHQYAEAADAFQKLKSETQDPFDKNKYSFWLAKSLKQAGKEKDASNQFQELTQNDPLGFYGLVAYREMNKEIPALSLETRKVASDEDRPSSVDSKDHDMILSLNQVNEAEILQNFLDEKTSNLRLSQSQNQELWLYFLKAYARAGLYNPLFQQIGNLTPELKAQLLAQNPELLFPRKFLDLIQTWATKFNVKPELMLSIIRQESAFNPQARSGADAVGLMQLLPSVARAHEKQTGLKFDHFEELYKPEMNIPFGASLLADLGKKYRGQLVLTAAAYNANEKAIENWIKTRLKDDPLEFIEDIPYEETRAYVKLVLRNFIFYSRLSQPGQKLAFPNWCLDDLQSFKVSTN